ncbi:MAG: hypothetical protein Q8921_09625 [Bacteroidota bacterium]|nr:hypothetical protein [Bacteroidota bacterium]
MPYSVVVYDGTNQLPLELARVALYRGAMFVKGKVTNPEGRALFIDLKPGRYRLVVRSVGYNEFSDTVLIDKTHTMDSVQLFETGGEVVVSGSREAAISTVEPTTGNQVFEAETYHAPPTARITQLVQENVLGAVRAPTGEVHIRGQHGELTYFVDGAPIPLGVFGGLNEVVDPKVIERSTFLTGGFPAEYGGQIAAVMDIQTRVPTGQLHFDFSSYAGSYLPNGNKDTLVIPNGLLNSNGQQLAVSDHVGKLAFFLSGSRQETDRRIDPPIPSIVHDHGFDYFLYGKADYLLSDKDYLTLNLNYGITNTQVPFDSVETGGPLDDYQYTTNAFQTLSYFRTLSSESDHESNIFATGYAREGSLTYTPGAIDRAALQPNGDTIHVASETRNFTTLGIRTKYDHRLSHELEYAAGVNFSMTAGHADFSEFDSARFSGPHSVADFQGSDFGAFLQGEIHPAEWTRFDVGLRYDQHIAPDVPMESQLSPRIRWNFLLGESDDAYLYYGRLFMPTNIEGIRSLSLSSGEPSTVQGTRAERDNLYEAVYTHSFDFGIHTKLAAFRKDATPGLDDETIGSSAIKTPINIEQIHASGLELGLSFSSTQTPLSGYLNTAIIHAYGSGLITGGFLPISTVGPAQDLDHDQRLSVVASLNYQPEDWFANATGIYGSGLTNGNPSNEPYGTGLFDFNQFAHVMPSWIVNLSAGYTFHLTGGTTIAPSLFVGNLLDHQHLIKGAYFSGASWEESRNVIFRVDIHI